MARETGIIKTTYQNLVIDSGAVYKNFVDPTSLGTRMGATRGGSAFSIEQEWKDMPVDGAHGKVKGGKRLIGLKATLTCNFIEIAQEILKRALPGSAITNLPVTHKTFSRSLTLADTDYLGNVVIVGEMSGSTGRIICGVTNALADGNFEMNFADKEEAGVTLAFSGHFLPEALDTEPWILMFPDDISTPTPE